MRLPWAVATSSAAAIPGCCLIHALLFTPSFDFADFLDAISAVYTSCIACSKVLALGSILITPV